MHMIKMVGLDGGNLLGYLAALGTLGCIRTLQHDPRLSWTFSAEGWIPALHLPDPLSDNELAEVLAKHLSDREMWTHRFSLGIEPAPDNLTISSKVFSQVLRSSAITARSTERFDADFFCGIGTDGFSEDKATVDSRGATVFRTMSGQGHQHFLGFMRDLAQITSADHIHRSLFHEWDYGDRQKSMRWDPLDDRRYALRAFDPGNTNKGPIQTMWGANRLAIEALSFFPVVFDGREMATASSSRQNGQLTVTWPVWEPSLSVEAIKSLLTHQEFILTNPRKNILAALGVTEVFRSRRVNNGKFRNFSPATTCLGGIYICQ